jgi:hypothetical protein
LDSGLLPAQQSGTAKKLLERMDKAIPFTTQEVMDAHYAGAGENIGQMGKRVSSKNAAPTWTDADEKRLQELEAQHGSK